MKQIPLFSLVIFPTIEQQNLIASYKNLLKENIGWYASANSTAHITIINLENEFLLELYINQIEDYCKTIIPKKVKFNSLNHLVKIPFLYPQTKNLNTTLIISL